MNRLLLAIVIAMAFGFPQGANAKSDNTVAVVPIDGKTDGKSYGTWAERWWEWALAIPAGPGHPLFDLTGADCGVGQSANVWFLGGVYNESHTVVRDCNVPAGKDIFFPILNYVVGDFKGQELNDPVDGPNGLRAQLKAQVDTATDLACEIDGVPVPNLASYRTQSPVNYPPPTPDNNLFGVPGGLLLYILDEGFYLMLQKPSHGDHTLHFHGKFNADGFTLDITYRLHIGN